MKPQHLEVAGLREDGKQAIMSKRRENRTLLFLTLSYRGLPAGEAATLPSFLWMSSSKKSSCWCKGIDWHSQLHLQIHFVFSVSFLTLYRIPKHWQMQNINMDSSAQFSQVFYTDGINMQAEFDIKIHSWGISVGDLDYTWSTIS